MARTAEKAQPDRRSDRLGHDRALRRDGALPGLTVDSDRSTYAPGYATEASNKLPL